MRRQRHGGSSVKLLAPCHNFVYEPDRPALVHRGWNEWVANNKRQHYTQIR